MYSFPHTVGPKPHQSLAPKFSRPCIYRGQTNKQTHLLDRISQTHQPLEPQPCAAIVEYHTGSSKLSNNIVHTLLGVVLLKDRARGCCHHPFHGFTPFTHHPHRFLSHTISLSFSLSHSTRSLSTLLSIVLFGLV
jgi:hypothetical protein